jgi:hypothetical protein
MKNGPLFPIFGEDFSFHEEFAAENRQNPRQTLRYLILKVFAENRA